MGDYCPCMGSRTCSCKRNCGNCNLRNCQCSKYVTPATAIVSSPFSCHSSPSNYCCTPPRQQPRAQAPNQIYVIPASLFRNVSGSAGERLPAQPTSRMVPDSAGASVSKQSAPQIPMASPLPSAPINLTAKINNGNKSMSAAGGDVSRSDEELIMESYC